MQQIGSSNPPMVTGICDPNKSRARHRRSLKVEIPQQKSSTEHKFVKISFKSLICFVSLILFLTNKEDIITLETSLFQHFLPKLIISLPVFSTVL